MYKWSGYAGFSVKRKCIYDRLNKQGNGIASSKTETTKLGSKKSGKGKKYRTSSTAVEDYVVLDFETTGFRAGADRIIQMGVVKYVKHEMTDILNTLVNPQRHIPIAFTQLTGIYQYCVRGH